MEIEKRSGVFHRDFYRNFSRARKVILVSKIGIHIKRRVKSKHTWEKYKLERWTYDQKLQSPAWKYLHILRR